MLWAIKRGGRAVISDVERTLTAPAASDGGFWTLDYLLRHCEGYMVDGPGGHVGFVSEVIETAGSVELVVETGCGELHVSPSAIEEFDPLGERVVIILGAR
jgi:hypothetical protein